MAAISGHEGHYSLKAFQQPPRELAAQKDVDPLMLEGMRAVRLVESSISSATRDDWQPSKPYAGENLGAPDRRDWNPKPGEVDARYKDNDNGEPLDRSVHLKVDSESGQATEFHLHTHHGICGPSEMQSLKVDEMGRRVYQTRDPEGHQVQVVLDQNRGTVAVLTQENATPVYRAPGEGAVEDKTPIDREALAKAMTGFKLPFDSSLHGAYRNQPWFIPVMEDFIHSAGAALGEGKIDGQGLHLHYRLFLDEAARNGRLPEAPPSFGGIQDVQSELIKNLYPLTKHFTSEGFAESYRQAYIRSE